jgi:hypothetical protein
MQFLALDADASVMKHIMPSPVTVAADLSSVQSNVVFDIGLDTGPDKDNYDNNEEYRATPAYLHQTVSSKSKQVGSQKIKFTSKYSTYLQSNAFNPHLF